MSIIASPAQIGYCMDGKKPVALSDERFLLVLIVALSVLAVVAWIHTW